MIVLDNVTLPLSVDVSVALLEADEVNVTDVVTLADPLLVIEEVRLIVSVPDTVDVTVRELLPEEDGEPERESDAEVVPVTEVLGDTEGEAVAETVVLALYDGVNVQLADGLPDTVAEADNEVDRLVVGDTEGLTVPLAEYDGVTDGEAVIERVTEPERELDADAELDTDRVPDAVPDTVGVEVGVSETENDVSTEGGDARLPKPPFPS